MEEEENEKKDDVCLKMTSAQVVETSVTNNSSFQNYSHDHTIQTTDTPGFKPFTKIELINSRRIGSVHQYNRVSLFWNNSMAAVTPFSVFFNCMT